MSHPIRHDWSMHEIEALYNQPLLELIYQAATIHRQFHDPKEVQVCQVISVKTGGCPEDCAFCAQSSRYKNITPVQVLSVDEVLAKAKRAVDKGASRICLAAGWRDVRPNKYFDDILKMVEGIRAMGVEVCCTLGMLKAPEAEKLREAGMYAYNHNLDTSRDYYPNITTTRTYQDRLDTLDVVEEANLSVCCGGIIGMGESIQDRLSMLQTLASRHSHPESVPINLLERIPGTALEENRKVSPWELIRMVATARTLMPKAKVRLSAGRRQLSQSEQGLCFLAGANSIHSGEKLLTVSTHSFDDDDIMFEILGLQKQKAFETTPCH